MNLTLNMIKVEYGVCRDLISNSDTISWLIFDVVDSPLHFDNRLIVVNQVINA